MGMFVRRRAWRAQEVKPGRSWVVATAVIAVGASLAVAAIVALPGCARNGDYASVGRSVSDGQQVEILAPRGHLATGDNAIKLRLTRAGDHAPLDVAPQLDFAQSARGAAPLHAAVTLVRAAPGDFDGKATFDAQGIWWANLTFNGAGGTQTIRVRVAVGK